MAHYTRPVCLFCRQTDMSGEHLFSDWLRALYPVDRPSKHFSTNFKYQDAGPPTKQTRKHRRAINQVKLYVVCTCCNTAWMSRLEMAAKPILTALIKMEGITLSTAKQQTLAQWAAKVATVAEAGTHHAISTAMRDRLSIKKSKLSDNWRVWIGQRGLIKPELAALTHSVALVPEGAPTSLNCNSCVLMIGPLLIWVFYSRIKFKIDESAGVLDPLYGVWPTTSDITWPAAKWITDAGMKLILLALIKNFSRPKFIPR